MTLFTDRRAAGRAVAERLAGRPRRLPAVIGLPRGGVPVAAEVACVLHAPLDVLVVRKLGVPGHEELAMGAIAAVAGTVQVVSNDDVRRQLGVEAAAFDDVLARERAALARREVDYRGQRPPLQLAGREVIVVDDGLATGATMRAAVAAVRGLDPAAVVVAVPVGFEPACALLAGEADEVVCLSCPAGFVAVGQAYADFSPTTDDQVRAALAG